MGLVIYGVDLDDMKTALTEEAKSKAASFEKGLNTSKLRQYYQVVSSIYEKMCARKDSDCNDLWMQFYLLKARSNYDKTRRLVNEEFKRFIESAVDNVKTKEDLERFKLFFEAIVGFFPKSTAN